MSLDPDSTATAVLRHAVAEMPDGAGAPGALFAAWSTIGRQHINEWIDDLDASLIRAAEANARSQRAGPDHGVGDAEVCLWWLDTAVEKLVGTCAVILGVRCVRLIGDGVVFRPNARHVVAKLRDLAGSWSVAEDLLQTARILRELPARRLRNEISHTLSQVGGVRPLCFLDVRFHHNGMSAYQEARTLFPSFDIWSNDDIQPDTIYHRVLEVAEEAQRQLNTAIMQLAELVACAGRLEPPTIVYYDLDTRTTSFAAPER